MLLQMIDYYFYWVRARDACVCENHNIIYTFCWFVSVAAVAITFLCNFVLCLSSFFPFSTWMPFDFYGIITTHHAHSHEPTHLYMSGSVSTLRDIQSKCITSLTVVLVLHSSSFWHYHVIKSSRHVWLLMEPSCINHIHCWKHVLLNIVC